MLESWNVGKTKGKSQGGVISIELIGSMEFGGAAHRNVGKTKGKPQGGVILIALIDSISFGGAAHRNIQEGWKYGIDQLNYFLLS